MAGGTSYSSSGKISSAKFSKPLPSTVYPTSSDSSLLGLGAQPDRSVDHPGTTLHAVSTLFEQDIHSQLSPKSTTCPEHTAPVSGRTQSPLQHSELVPAHRIAKINMSDGPQPLAIDGTHVSREGYDCYGSEYRYTMMPTLMNNTNWPEWDDALEIAAMEERVLHILLGTYPRPKRPVEESPVDTWTRWEKEGRC
jgi:hypothetical protein